MRQVTLEEAGSQLSQLIQEALQGEDVIITQENAPDVKLVPIKLGRKVGTAAGLVFMADDFDAPLDDFKEYM